MAELTLKRNEIEVLEVTIDDKNYSIPLGTSLRRKDLAKLKNEDEVMKFFELSREGTHGRPHHRRDQDDHHRME